MSKWLAAVFSIVVLGSSVGALERPAQPGPRTATPASKAAPPPHPPTIFRPAKRKPAVERPKPAPPDDHAPVARRRGANGRAH